MVKIPSFFVLANTCETNNLKNKKCLIFYSFNLVQDLE